MPINLVDQLDLEWETLVSSNNTFHAWSQLCTQLTTCATLDEVLTAVRSSPDEVLGFLIARCQAGDRLAGRTVLQTMLGKLVKMSYSGAAAREPNALNDLVTHMWCQIARYPLDRRPRSVAANLALDTLKAAHHDWRAADTETLPTQPTSVVSQLDRRPAPHPDPSSIWTAEELIGAAYRLGHITRTTHDILVAVYGPEALSGAAAAQRWDCTPAAIRTRCRTAIRRQLQPLARQLTAA